jgi:hypothetical protein
MFQSPRHTSRKRKSSGQFIFPLSFKRQPADPAFRWGLEPSIARQRGRSLARPPIKAVLERDDDGLQNQYHG